MKRPKVKPFQGISKDVEKDIEEAVSSALSSEKNNPTSDYNTKKGRNNTSRYGPKDRKKRTGSGLTNIRKTIELVNPLGMITGVPDTARLKSKETQKFSGGGRARGFGAAQTSGLGGGETY
jgi:hypothetical protein